MAVSTAKGIQTGAWINVVIGVIVFAVPFFTVESVAAFWNNIIVGIAIVALAGWNAWAASQGRVSSALGPAVVNVILGVWLMVFAFFAVAEPAFLWWTGLMGLALVIVAGYNAWASSTARRGAVAGGRTPRA